MKLYALCSARSEIQDVRALEPGHEPIKVKFGIPENAAPLTIEYQEAVVNKSTGDIILPPTIMVHYLVPCNEAGNPLCEICNERVADKGTICAECEEITKEHEAINYSANMDDSENPDNNSDLPDNTRN